MPRKTVNKEEIVDEVEEVVTVKRRKPVVNKRPKIARDEVVSCTSAVEGVLTYVSKKTGLRVVWSNYGDVEFIDFEELLTMKASQDMFLTRPWITLDNEDVIEYFGLTKMYENMIDMEDLDSFFGLPISEMLEILKKLPKGYRQTIGQRARSMVEDGSLYDTRITRLLATELGIDFTLIQN